MGYTTDFKGRLDFHRELVGSEFVILKGIFGEDCREHTDWPQPYKYGLAYMDLKLTDDMKGIEWDGAEKSSPMEHLVNVLIDVASRDIPDFVLTGAMACQGEDMDDRWTLVMRENVAIHVDAPRSGRAISCPFCEHKIYVDETEDWVD